MKFDAPFRSTGFGEQHKGGLRLRVDAGALTFCRHITAQERRGMSPLVVGCDSPGG